MDLDLQLDLFRAALDEIEQDGDLVNKALEVTLEDWSHTEYLVERYSIPQNGPYVQAGFHTGYAKRRT